MQELYGSSSTIQVKALLSEALSADELLHRYRCDGECCAGLQCLKLQRVRLGSLRLPDRLQPGEGEPLSGTDKYRMLDSQATRSMILNSSPGMLVTRTVKAFHLPKSRPAQRSALVDAR